MWFMVCIMYCKFTLGSGLVCNYSSPSSVNIKQVMFHYKGLHSSEKLSTSLSLNSSAESKLGESSLTSLSSAVTLVLCTVGCCVCHRWLVNGHTCSELHTPVGGGRDSPILGVDLRRGCHWEWGSQGESNTCTWGEGCREAYLRKEWPMLRGTGLEEAEREPVPEWMAESMEMVMGALQKGEAAMSSNPPEGDISSSSKSSSSEEWSGNSWCLWSTGATVMWSKSAANQMTVLSCNTDWTFIQLSLKWIFLSNIE